jgi:ferredoxin
LKIKVTNTDSDKTVLELLEFLGVTEIHSECRDGYCGACKCIVDGEVEYRNGDPIAYLDKSNNEVTVCTAHIPKNSFIDVYIS